MYIAIVCAALCYCALADLVRHGRLANKRALYKSDHKSDADELVRVLVQRRIRLEQAKKATETTSAPYRSCGCHCHSENNKP
jgi:hypothetical protein